MNIEREPQEPRPELNRLKRPDSIRRWQNIGRGGAILFTFAASLAGGTPAKAEPSIDGGGTGGAKVSDMFKLGFHNLAEQIPGVAGEPLEAEHYAPNGDSLQQTSTGLMVWRKTDNWTAFTDGVNTYLNGLNGLAVRPNDKRFDWESDGQIAGVQATPIPTFVTLPEVKATPVSSPEGLYLGKYQATGTLEQELDGKKYTLQTLVSPSASRTVLINEGAKATLLKFISEEGKKNGFENARIIVLGQDEQVEGVNMDWEKRLVQNKYEMIGFFGSQRLGQDVNLFYRTDTTTPFNNPDFMRIIGSSLSAKFVNMAVLGGSLDTNGMFGTAPTPEQLSRIIGTGNWYPGALDLVPYSPK